MPATISSVGRVGRGGGFLISDVLGTLGTDGVVGHLQGTASDRTDNASHHLVRGEGGGL